MPRVTAPEANAYAAKLRSTPLESLCDHGAWHAPRTAQHGNLVEVWVRGTEGLIHPSRNPFRWVRDANERTRLHKLAADPRSMLMFQAGENAMRRGQVSRNEPVSGAKRHPKSVVAPAWAQRDKVIGYTSAQPIAWAGDRPRLTGIDSFPSIYYEAGHATMDHDTPGNIGWEFGTGWICLFFGNRP